jgi:hypothetical protein
VRRRSPSVACPVAGRSYASAVSPARSERVREAMCQTDLTWPITSPLPVPVAFDESVSTASGSNSVSGQESTAVQTERSGAEQTPLPPVAAATSVVSSAPAASLPSQMPSPTGTATSVNTSAVPIASATAAAPSGPGATRDASRPCPASFKTQQQSQRQQNNNRPPGKNERNQQQRSSNSGRPQKMETDPGIKVHNTFRMLSELAADGMEVKGGFAQT